MKSILRATILIAAFSILSKVLGAARQAVFANKFGAGETMDVYVAAFRIPDLVFNFLVLGTLSVAFIPVFIEYLKRDKKDAYQIASTVFSGIVIIMSAFAVVGYFVAPFLVKLIAPGFRSELTAQTVGMTRIMLLSPVFFAASSVLTSVLHSHRRFMIAAISPLFYNLAIIFGVLLVYPYYGLNGLAWSVVAGACVHFAIQFPFVLRLGLTPFSKIKFSLPGVKKIVHLYVPRIFGISLSQLSTLIASIIGSGLAAGSLAIFYFAYDLNTVPLGIFAVSFSVAAFPVLSDYVAKNDMIGFKKFLAKTTVQILFLIIPMSVLMLLLRAQIVRLILGAGQNTQFNFSATKLTAQALGFFVLSLFAQSLIPLLGRAFYAMQNTMTPVVIGLVSTVINIILAVFFTRTAGADTLALAFSIAIVCNMLMLLILLHRRLGGLEDQYLAIRTIKISVASIVMGVSAYIALYLVAPLVDMQTYVGVLVQMIIAVCIAMAVYLMVGYAIKLPETRDIMGILRSWIGKYGKPISSGVINILTDVH